MKRITKLVACCVVSLLVFTSCLDFLNELLGGGDNDETSSTEQIQNSEGGNLELNNYEVQMIPGTLPNGANDNVDPNTTLSVELDVEAPAPIPSNYELIGKIVRYGPEGFVFNYPVSIYFPAKDVSDPINCKIIRYDFATEEWVQVPITLMAKNPNRLGASVIELGIFALVEQVSSSSMKSTQAADSEGGCRLGNFTSSNWYSLVVKSVISLEYPDQASWYGGRLVGSSAMSGTNATGDSPINPVHMRLPQGRYQIWVSKLVWNRVSGGEWWTYTVPATVTISNPLRWTGSWSSDQDHAYEGWVSIELSGGDWVKGRPEDLPPMSRTVGTGDFQTTLTWINNSGSTTDLDLHLYGPNNLHVYYSNKTPSGSAFNLDYDWTHPVGNAVENIYSINNDWPSGEYRVTVLLYGGYTPKSFTTRTIRGASSRTVPGTFAAGTSNGTEIEVYRFTVN